MKKPNKESILIAGYISGFLDGYVLSQKTDSMNTLKSYRDAIVLYLFFLENEKKIHSDSLNADCFRHTVIEEWLSGCGNPGDAARRAATTGWHL